ncbi:hypothetical protein Tco_1430635 [Tanacetum coccineum]
MDNPNITMEEYIRLEEEKAHWRGKVYNWETAKYGKICVSSLNNNEIDFRISFDESDDEDYTVIFDKNSFSYKIIYVNDLKMDSENDNEKVNMPSFPLPEPKVCCFDDLDFFKDFENVFPAIVYNDALTSKSKFLTKPTLSPQHIDEFDLKDETSLSEYDEVEQNVLYFNDLFPFNIIYLDDLKSDKDNDDNEIDIIQSSGGDVNTKGSNTLLEASHNKINKVFIMEDFNMELNVNIVAWNYLFNGILLNLIKNLYVSFGISFDSKQYYKDGVYIRMLRRPRAMQHMAPLPPRDQRHLWLRYQVEGYTKEIVHDFEDRLETIFGRQVNRVHVLDFEVLTPEMRQDLAERLRMVYTGDDGQEIFVSHAWRRLFKIRAPLVHEFILEFFSTCRVGNEMGLDAANTLCFQLGGARRSMTWRQFILVLGLHTTEEMVEDGFEAYWLGSERVIPDKGDLSDYWIEISSDRDFLRVAPSYTYIKDLVRRLCYRLISCSISGRGQAPEKVTSTDLFYLRSIDRGAANVLYLLAQYLFRNAEGRKSGARLSGGHFIGRLAHHFGLVSDDGLRGLSVVTRELTLIDMGELVKINICMEVGDDWAWVAQGAKRQPVVAAAAIGCAEDVLDVYEGAQAVPAPIDAPPPLPPATGRTMPQRLGRLEEEIQGLRQDIGSLRGLVERSMTDQGRFSTWMISCMTQLMEASVRTYQAFDGTFRGSYPVVFERRTRQRTDSASTSIA